MQIVLQMQWIRNYCDWYTCLQFLNTNPRQMEIKICLTVHH